MKSIRYIFLYLVSYNAYSQLLDTETIDLNLYLPVVTLLDIETGTENFTLHLEHSGNPGEPLTNDTYDATWINYSCSLAPGSSLRNISAHISSGEMLSGTEILLTAGQYSGSGAGEHGVSTGTITLSSSPQNIIENIGGAFTNNGVNNGHQLTYELNINSYRHLNHENSTLTINFTLTDN